jgi:osmotically-inducible protein OsmY
VLVVKDSPWAASRVVKEGRSYGESLMASTSPIAVGSSSDGSRSGDEIALAAASSLRAGPYPVLRNISCRCESGQLTLTGAVGSFYLKQIAQTIVARVPGVGRIDNRLEVLSYR